MLESDGATLVKKPHLDTKPDSHQCGRKSAGDTFTSSTDSRKKGSHRWHFLIDTVFNLITIIFVVLVGMFQNS